MKRNKLPAGRVLASLKGQPWAIRPDVLNTLMAVASRELSDPVQAKAMSEQYEAGGFGGTPPPGVAIIDITGPIFTRADFFSDVSGATTAEHLTQALDDALQDDAVDSIILRMDSPGGEVTGIHELANHIFASRDVKPIVAYVSGGACSAAYWLASATSWIFADKTALLGSIGVVATWTDDSAAREKMGVTDYEVISSQSPNKRLKPDSDEGRAALQAEIDGLADIFISDVATFRATTPEQVVADFGGGGTFLAESAVSAGMADELSSLRDVVALLSEQGNNNVAVTPSGGPGMAAFNRNKTRTRATRQAQDDVPQDIIPDDGPDQDENLPDDITDPDDFAEDEEEIRAQNEDENEPVEDEQDQEDEDEDRENETTATHSTVEKFSRTDKKLYRAILRRGARRERRRIESLEELAGPGREQILKAAKFTRPRTVSATMRTILRADKDRRAQMQEDLRADGNFRAPQSAMGTQAGAQKAAETAILEQIKLGAAGKTGIRKK